MVHSHLARKGSPNHPAIGKLYFKHGIGHILQYQPFKFRRSLMSHKKTKQCPRTLNLGYCDYKLLQPKKQAWRSLMRLRQAEYIAKPVRAQEEKSK